MSLFCATMLFCFVSLSSCFNAFHLSCNIFLLFFFSFVLSFTFVFSYVLSLNTLPWILIPLSSSVPVPPLCTSHSAGFDSAFICFPFTQPFAMSQVSATLPQHLSARPGSGLDSLCVLSMSPLLQQLTTHYILSLLSSLLQQLTTFNISVSSLVSPPSHNALHLFLVSFPSPLCPVLITFTYLATANLSLSFMFLLHSTPCVVSSSLSQHMVRHSITILFPLSMSVAGILTYRPWQHDFITLPVSICIA